MKISSANSQHTAGLLYSFDLATPLTGGTVSIETRGVVRLENDEVPVLSASTGILPFKALNH